MIARKILLGTAAVGTALPLLAGRRGWWGWPVAHACMVFPTVIRNYAAWGPLVRGFQTDSREVWLTIDDGPTTATTPAYLDVLDHYRARATFFLIGCRVDRARDLAYKIITSGHQAGNHTYSHHAGAWWALPPGSVRREIDRGRTSIHAATGATPTLFRSPVGMTNPWVHPALRAGEQCVGWSASGVDGLQDRGVVVVDRIMQRIKPGGILVLHESEVKDDRRVETLELLLKSLAADGWKCVIPKPEQFVA